MRLDHHQRYLVEEFAADYLARRMSRRDLLRRALQVTGSVPLTASVLFALGCGGLAPGATPTPPPATPAETVRFPGLAGELIASRARPRADGVYPGVVVIHENRGLVDHIKDVARRYAKEGFVAVAVDLASRG